MEPREDAAAVESKSSEPVDEEIESLLVSLDQPIEAAQRRSEAGVAREAHRGVSREQSMRRRDRVGVNRFDLFVVVTAVALGFAVGLLTVFFVSS